ncbi:MAG TPA: hypothetical protein VIL35_01030 [Vicinamibacterales bacterium]
MFAIPLRTVLVAFVLLACTIVLPSLLPIAAVTAQITPPPDPGRMLAWLTLSCLLQGAMLVGLAGASHLRGGRLWLLLFVVAVGVGQVLALLEAVVFGVVEPGVGFKLGIHPTIAVALAAAVTCALVRRDPPRGPADLVTFNLPRLAAVAGLYTIVYFTAGTLVFPWIEWFYTARTMPSTVAVVALQLFVRGPMFGLIVLFMLRGLNGSVLARGIWTGLALSIFGAVASLVLPNPFMPDQVRWAHLIEVGVSNFLFALLAAAILGGYRARETAVRRSGADESARPGTSIA